jgi:hypothetical protein
MDVLYIFVQLTIVRGGKVQELVGTSDGVSRDVCHPLDLYTVHWWGRGQFTNSSCTQILRHRVDGVYDALKESAIFEVLLGYLGQLLTAF